MRPQLSTLGRLPYPPQSNGTLLLDFIDEINAQIKTSHPVAHIDKTTVTTAPPGNLLWEGGRIRVVPEIDLVEENPSPHSIRFVAPKTKKIY